LALERRFLRMACNKGTVLQGVPLAKSLDPFRYQYLLGYRNLLNQPAADEKRACASLAAQFEAGGTGRTDVEKIRSEIRELRLPRRPEVFVRERQHTDG
jgi:hypothetical protein